MMNKKGQIEILFVISFLVFLLLIAVAGFFTVIPAGHGGVVLSFGAVTGKEMHEGLNFKVPFIESVEIMNGRIQLHEEESHAGTKDLQAVTTFIALNYHVNLDHMSDIYQTMGRDEELVRLVISPSIDESVKAISAKFNSEELITNRNEVKLLITAELETRLAEFYITVDEVSIRNLQFSAEYDAAIEAKQVAQQKALQSEQELNMIRIEAQQTVVKAQAEADSILAVARAQSEANELLTESLTAEILRKQWISKWDGILPTYMLGEGSNILMNIE